LARLQVQLDSDCVYLYKQALGRPGTRHYQSRKCQHAQATGWTGIRTISAPISCTLIKCSLLQCPCDASLSGSEIDNPRNRMVLPSGSTNLFPFAEIKGNFLTFCLKDQRPGSCACHHPAVCCCGGVCATAIKQKTIATPTIKQLIRALTAVLLTRLFIRIFIAGTPVSYSGFSSPLHSDYFWPK
jgi:hypothetical protein